MAALEQLTDVDYNDTLEEEAAVLRGSVRFEVRVLYPSEARTLLARHATDANRKLSNGVVRRYARDIAGGRFKPNVVDLIAIDRRGIRNGMHRIKAVAESGSPIIAGFVYCEDLEWLYSQLDAGEKRTWAQDKSREGLQRANDWAAVLKWLYRYALVDDGGRLVGEKKPTVSELDVLYEANLDIGRSLAVVGHREAMAFFIPRSILATVHYLGAKTNQEAADEFVARVLDGIGQPEGSAVLAIRRALLPKQGAQRSLPRDYKLALTIKAWLAYEDDKPIKLVKWLPSEPFPRFRTNWPDPD